MTPWSSDSAFTDLQRGLQLITIVLGILVFLLLAASGVVVVKLIRLTQFRRVWTLIGLAVLLTAVVHTIELVSTPHTALTELLYLLAASLLLAGLLAVRPMYAAFRSSVEGLNDAEKRLRETRRKLDDVLSNAPLVVFAIDNEGTFTMSEGGGLEALGLSPGEVVGESVYDLYRDYPDILSCVRSALAGEEVVSTIDIVDRAYDVYYSPLLGARGKVTGVFGVSVDVSKRKHTEAQLRATKDRFRALIETTSDWAWEVDSDGVYTYSSPKVRDLLGYEPDELIGKTPFDVMEPEFGEVVRNVFEGFVARRLPFNGLVNTCLHKDGHEVILETSGVPIFDGENTLIGYRGIDRDITERTKAEHELRKHRDTAQMYLDIAGVMLVVIGRDHKVTLINPKGCEILGYEESDIVGRDWFENFLPEYVRDTVVSGFDELMRGDLQPMEYFENPVLTSSGEERLIAWHNTMIYDEEGNVTGSLSSGSDVTDRRRAERERQNLEAQLQHSQRMETIGTLAGGIAHDFNNILSPILGYTDLVMEDLGENHPTYSNLQEVVKAGHRAKELVQQIMVFSRQMDRDVGPIHLHLVVREALKFIRASLPTTIEIQQNVSIESGVVRANSTQIHHLLVNLCTNSAHSMRESGGLLRVELQPFEVDEEMAGKHTDLATGSYARLSVRDTGRGMDEKTRERMFEPFFTTREVGDGTGLGLSVVHGIVASHNGVIAVDSQPGEGTTITVYFPTAPSAPARDVIPDPAEVSGDERVLFVDDEEAITRLGRHMLGRLGYSVTTASNGIDALEILKAQPDGFDVLITDQTMPGLTGLELIREVRIHRPELPVLLITGFSEKVTPEIIADLKIDGFLIKPLVANKIGAAIRRALDVQS
jgi:PAS domain S-box-containing protein